jgi:hypothetical protein
VALHPFWGDMIGRRQNRMARHREHGRADPKPSAGNPSMGDLGGRFLSIGGSPMGDG